MNARGAASGLFVSVRNLGHASGMIIKLSEYARSTQPQLCDVYLALQIYLQVAVGVRD